MKTLPTFQGYTVDVRLREFRKLVYGQTPSLFRLPARRGNA